jgi:hypothetical protein
MHATAGKSRAGQWPTPWQQRVRGVCQVGIGVAQVGVEREQRAQARGKKRRRGGDQMTAWRRMQRLGCKLAQLRTPPQPTSRKQRPKGIKQASIRNHSADKAKHNAPNAPLTSPPASEFVRRANAAHHKLARKAAARNQPFPASRTARPIGEGQEELLCEAEDDRGAGSTRGG